MVNSTLFWALKGMDSKLSMTTQQNNSTLQQQDEGLWSLSKRFMVRKCFCTVSLLINILTNLYIFRVRVNIVKFFAALISVTSMLAYIMRIKDVCIVYRCYPVSHDNF